MFKPVPARPNTTQMEDALTRFWKTWRIAEKCEEERRGGVEYVYFENPPSPASKPDFSQAVTHAFSDLFLRYKTMRGYHISRRVGWQAHGLPVEIMAARQFGVIEKGAIEELGVAKFNLRCSDLLNYYAPYWERLNDHLGYWVDPKNAILTSSNEYIESVWWAVKSLWDKGLLYQALKVLPYCPSCGVHLSDHEIRQGDNEVIEPAVYVRFPLVNGPGTSLLVFTTHPWTLLGNVAIAVNSEAEYITIEQEVPGGGLEHLVVAKKLAKKVFGDSPLKIVDKFKGRKLKGEAYFPLYTFVIPQKSVHHVIADDFVKDEIGAGLMHLAPIFNEQDLIIAQEYDLPLLNPITDSGVFIPEVRPWSGKFVESANPFIIQDLDARGLLFKAEPHSHAERRCSFCNSPLLDYARNTWFIRISQYGDRALSYDRFWGTPLPIWECPSCHHQACVGSVEELAQLAGKDLADLDLHRPYLDEIFLKCPECQGQLTRIPELVKPWFETSCIPFAASHYPFENKSEVEKRIPVDFVSRLDAQTDDWLEGMQAMSGILFGKPGYVEAINLGALSLDRQKTVSQENGGEPLDYLTKLGADVFRWHLFDCWQAEGRQLSPQLLSEDAIKEIRKTISSLWNVYAGFIDQAKQDDWSPVDIPEKPQYRVLDRWLRSELHALILNVTTAFDTYDPHRVVADLQKFIDLFSRFYIRQSRPRFDQRAMDADKAAAYAVVYETLTTLSRLCAPVTPFLADELYQNLAAKGQVQGAGSVHLTDWPIADLECLDDILKADMAVVMELISLGRVARNKARLSPLQPLAEITFFMSQDEELQRIESYTEIIRDALKVKQATYLDSSKQASYSPDRIVSQGNYQAVLDTQLTPGLIDEGSAQQVIHRVKTLLKRAGLAVDEPIRLYIKAAPGLSESIFRSRQLIATEAIVKEMSEGSLPARGVLSQFEINGEKIIIGIEKIS